MTKLKDATLKTVVVAVIVVGVVAATAIFLWARSVLTGDAVRTALAEQISNALGQPVTIAALRASVFPRVTAALDDVRIGEPVRIRVAELRVGTDLRALLSRRIEHATIRVDGARIDFPLPPLAPAATGNAAPAEARSWPVALVSIDDVVLRDVELVSGGRTLRGDVEAVPRNGAFAVNASLAAAATKFTATGTIADLSGPVADIALKARTLNVGELADFGSAFASGAGQPSSRATRAGTQAAAMNVNLSLDADRATFGTLAVDRFTGHARITRDGVVLKPIAFGVFGGRYDGALSFDPGEAASAFRTQATVTGIDVAAATRFAGTPDVISGRMTGRLDCSGRMTGASDLLPTLRGTARVDVTNGVVRNLGLVRGVVLATSMRAGASGALGGTSRDEPFSRLGATLGIANGVLTTNDLRFESSNLIMAAHGAVQMRAATLDLTGTLQLSDALSQQAGRDLLRYTQQGGRVTLPVNVSGRLAEPQVTIDVADLLKRALSNAAAEELKKRLKGIIPKDFSDLLKR